ncbi:MAG: hypothetical protein U1F58_09365 [Burkholderiales bacterium]
MRALSLLVAAAGIAWLSVQPALAQQAQGTLAANGKSAALTHATAYEVDSALEKGYMDVVVVLSDRALAPGDARDPDRLEALARSGALAGLVVRLDPDAKILSAAPLHQAFTTFIRSAAFVRWTPSAFDEKRVAGRLRTDGTQSEFGQKWSYDITFSAPIALDPAAKTVPRK